MYEMRVSRDLLLVAALFASSTLAERASAETVYFLMSEITQPCSTCDSYVLPISDPAAIDHARDLVANGLAAGSAIALARSAVGEGQQQRAAAHYASSQRLATGHKGLQLVTTACNGSH